jgi:hypothetical protein
MQRGPLRGVAASAAAAGGAKAPKSRTPLTQKARAQKLSKSSLRTHFRPSSGNFFARGGFICMAKEVCQKGVRGAPFLRALWPV